jgi:iron-sulfur cluster repair protein YtfE (RIC family)
MPSYDQLDATITVNDLLQRFPEAVGTLSAYGIDTCCRGNQSLARAAAFVGVDPDRLLAEVTSAKPAAPSKPCTCGCHQSQENSV